MKRLILCCYLAITAAAFVYTMTRRVILPWPLIRFSYGMMAPYQTFSTQNADLYAQGRFADDEWRPIDLSQYYPMGRGENQVRKYLLLWRWPALSSGDERELKRQYRRLAEQIYLRERERGSSLTAVKVSWVTWPSSPGGYAALRQWPYEKGEFLAQYP